MDHNRRLLRVLLLVSFAAAACSAGPQPSGTSAPGGGSGSGQPGASPSSVAPAGSPYPTSNPLQPDPDAATYYPRDPRAPARLTGTTHDIDLFIAERHMTVAEGIVREVWAYDGSVPGPVIRVQVGDTIRIHLDNRPPKLPGRAAWMHPAVNAHSHSIEFDGTTVAGNGELAPIKHGDKAVYEFKAEQAGVWMYHCGAEPMLEHLANGMFGMLIVEPRGGLEPVDQEFFLIGSEWYLGPPHESASLAKASAPAPAPDFVVLNGIADQYHDYPIQVETGHRVRVFVMNAGPNLDTSFRIEGAIFDRVIREGVELAAGNQEDWGRRAVDLAPSQGAIVEFTLSEDGLYPILTHALNWNGALGFFRAGDGDPLN